MCVLYEQPPLKNVLWMLYVMIALLLPIKQLYTSVSDFLGYISFIIVALTGPTHAQGSPQRPKGLQSSLIRSV